jgi:chromosomal replication initiation ATPase DnaA
MPGQLVFPFGARTALRREDFIVAPCNEQAFRFIERWPDWPVRAAAIYGPHASGKSHLVEVWCARSSAPILSAPHLTEDALGPIAPGAAVAVEQADIIPDHEGEERDRALLALFERPAGTLLLTGRTPPSEWPAASGLARKHFADRQIDVPENVVTRILTHVERTPEAIAAFVTRADRKAWVEKRAVGERLVLELIEEEERSRNRG